MNKLTNFFKILSDETRFRIVMLLAQQELCVCEICGILELSQPKVSKHLAKLRDIGLVRNQRKEQFIFYSLKIDEDVIANLITNIINNIDQYPQLNNDSERIIDGKICSDYCNRDGIKNKIDRLEYKI